MKNTILINAIIVTSLLLNACVADSPYSKIQNFSERIETPVYSVLPPQEPGWNYYQENPIKLTFGRLGNEEGQSYAGHVVVSRLADVNNKEEFFKLLSKQRARDAGNTRYEDLVNEETVEVKDGNYIFRFHTKYKDFGANNLPKNAKYLVIEDYGVGFQHPFKKNIVVTIALSQRASPSDINNNFSVLANKFISSIEFYDFNDQ
jgi:hypothetical protein